MGGSRPLTPPAKREHARNRNAAHGEREGVVNVCKLIIDTLAYVWHLRGFTALLRPPFFSLRRGKKTLAIRIYVV